MDQQDNGSEKSEGTDPLGEFLDEHYEKFAIMGIFVTVSVFLRSNWPGSEDSFTTLLATVASLGVFGIVALWIMVASAREIRISEDEWPGATEAGYAFIMVATGTLGGAVLLEVSSFERPAQILLEGVAATLTVLFYVKLNSEFLSEESESTTWEDIARGISFAVAWFLVVDAFMSSLSYWAEQLPVVSSVFLVHLFVGYIAFQFTIQHGLLGMRQLFRLVMNPKEYLRGPWSLWTSYAIVLLSLTVVTVYAKHTATSIGEGIGYYAILGNYWKRTITLYWLLCFGGSITLYLLEQAHSHKRTLIQRLGQIFALAVVGFAIANILKFIPQGRHIIPA